MFEKLTALFGKGSKELQTKRRIAAKLHDTPFKYISEKDETGVDTILARGGHLNLPSAAVRRLHGHHSV